MLDATPRNHSNNRITSLEGQMWAGRQGREEVEGCPMIERQVTVVMGKSEG